MALNIRRFLRAIGLIPNASQTISAQGEIEYRSDLAKLSVHDGTSADSVVQENKTATLTNKKLSDTTSSVVNAADATKAVAFNVAGNTTGTTLTISPAQTTSQSLAIPNVSASDAVVTNNTTATLTNKSLSDSTTAVVNAADATKAIKFSATGNTTGTSLTISPSQTTSQSLSIPNVGASDTLVTNNTAATLTNKTLTSPTINTPTLNGSGGALTLPAGPDTLVGRATTDTLTNKTLTSPVINTPTVNGSGGALTLPAGPDTLVGRATTDTLTNKTLTSPVINTPTVNSSGGALTLPAGPDTLVGRATTDTLSNKSISGSTNTLSNIPNSATTATNLNTSSAIVARDASGNFSAGTITANLSGNATNVTGIVAKANGGSGQDNTNITFPATGTLATTAGTQTLTAKTWGDAPTFTEIATPTAPSAGLLKFYPKTDGKFYKLDSTGAEVAVGSGSGSGGINYILNPDAESGLSGWATYSNTAQATPVNGTGGVANVTWTQTATSPLRGLNSFLFTKDALNRQGQGVSYDFTIENADLAKVLTVSFDYAIASGTYLDGDLTVYIYDKTNSQIIQPAGFKILSAATGLPVKQVSTTFQTASNSTSYRLIFHCASTSSSAYSIKFDSISVSPQIITQGTPVTDWQSYTLTPGAVTTAPGKGTVVVDNAEWRRVGGNMEIVWSYSQTTGGSAGSGTYLFPIPSGYSIDTAKLNSDSTANGSTGPAGVGSATDNSTGYLSAHVFAYDSTHLYMQPTGGTALIGSTASITFATANYKIALKASVPIVGWSSQVQMSSDTSTREISAILALASAVTPAANSNIKYDTVLWDNAGGYNPATGNYTISVPGRYKVSVIGETTGTTNFLIAKNGVQQYYLFSAPSGLITSGSGSLDYKAGDTLSVQVAQSNPVNGGTPYQNVVSIERISGPSQIAASESVNARYATSGAFAATSGQPINFATKSYDSHGAVTTGASWKFVAPAPGTYDVYGTFIITTGTGTVTLYKNGSSDNPIVSPDSTHWSSGTVQIQLNAGDYVDARLDSTQNITGFIYVKKVGN